MPKIPQYGGQQVSTQLVRGPRARNVDLGGQFLAQGLQNLGKGISAAEQEQAKLHAEQQARLAAVQEQADIMAAEEAALKLERATNDSLFNPDSGYYKMQGKSAYDGAQGVITNYDNLVQSFGKNLSPAALKAYSKVAEATKTKLMSDVNTHAMKGLGEHRVNLNNDTIKNAVEGMSAYWADDKEFKRHLFNGEEATIANAKLAGLDHQEAVETFRSTAIRSAIEHALAGEANAEAAVGLFERYIDHLEPHDKEAVANAIRKQREQSEIEQRAKVANTVANVAAEFSTLKEVLAHVKEKTGGDKELHDAAVKVAKSKWVLNQQVKNEESMSAENEISRLMMDGGKGLDELIATEPDAFLLFDKLNDAAYLRLRSADNKRVAAEQKAVAAEQKALEAELAKQQTRAQNYNKFKLATMHKDDLMAIDVNQLVDDEIITPAHGITIFERQKNIREGKEDQGLTTVNQVLKRFIDENFTSSKGKVDEAKAQRFYDIVEPIIEMNQRAKGADLKPSEIKEILNPEMVQWTINDKLFDPDVVIFGVEIDEDDIKATDKIVFNQVFNELGKGEQTGYNLAQVMASMIEHGENITTDTLMGRFNQALGRK